MSGEFIRFVVVGTIGFTVDGGITWLLVRAGVPPLVARIPALASAILVTWLLNRSLTFRVAAPKSRAELMRYVTVALSSAFLNFVVYGALVAIGVEPLLAVALATMLLLAYSFFAYRRVVFR
jgi:putative flippase GtrA